MSWAANFESCCMGNSRRRSKVPLRTPLVFSTNPLYNFEFLTKTCVLQAAIYLAKSFVGRLLRLPDADVAKDIPDFPAQEEEVEGSPENSPGVLYQPLVHLLSPLQLLKLLHKRVVTQNGPRQAQCIRSGTENKILGFDTKEGQGSQVLEGGRPSPW